MNKIKTLLPAVAALELTYQCNHQCMFCSCPWENDKLYKNDELSLEEWCIVIDKLYENGVKSFSLTGGESSLRKDLFQIIDHVLYYEVGLNIISNGKTIDDDFLNEVAKRRVSLCISVPGIDTFAEHTGVDNIEHVLYLFQKAKARGIHTTANITVTKKNLSELYENIAYPLINGADYILLNRFLPGGRGLDNTTFLLNIDELNQMLDTVEEVLEKANKYGHVGTELPLCAINNPSRYTHLQISNNCGAAKGFFVVDPSGYLKVCNHSPIRLCKYNELETLKNNEYWHAFQTRSYLPEMCINCNKNDICDGGCREAAHVYYGNITDSDPLFDKNITAKKVKVL